MTNFAPNLSLLYKISWGGKVYGEHGGLQERKGTEHASWSEGHGFEPPSVSVLLLWAGANPDDPFLVQKLA